MRTDKESQHDVTAELNRDPSVDASRFSVEVRDGVATLVERDDWPYEATVAAATQAGCDLIVMASHSRHDLAKRVLGGQTQRVHDHTDVSMLVVR